MAVCMRRSRLALFVYFVEDRRSVCAVFEAIMETCEK